MGRPFAVARLLGGERRRVAGARERPRDFGHPPHHGFPDRRKKPYGWCVDREFLYKMKELSAAGVGDQLDRAVIERHLEYDWMKDVLADDAEED